MNPIRCRVGTASSVGVRMNLLLKVAFLPTITLGAKVRSTRYMSLQTQSVGLGSERSSDKFARALPG